MGQPEYATASAPSCSVRTADRRRGTRRPADSARHIQPRRAVQHLGQRSASSSHTAASHEERQHDRPRRRLAVPRQGMIEQETQQLGESGPVRPSSQYSASNPGAQCWVRDPRRPVISGRILSSPPASRRSMKVCRPNGPSAFRVRVRTLVPSSRAALTMSAAGGELAADEMAPEGQARFHPFPELLAGGPWRFERDRRAPRPIRPGRPGCRRSPPGGTQPVPGVVDRRFVPRAHRFRWLVASFSLQVAAGCFAVLQPDLQGRGHQYDRRRWLWRARTARAAVYPSSALGAAVNAWARPSAAMARMCSGLRSSTRVPRPWPRSALATDRSTWLAAAPGGRLVTDGRPE